jgi:hypothetical protein
MIWSYEQVGDPELSYVRYIIKVMVQSPKGAVVSPPPTAFAPVTKVLDIAMYILKPDLPVSVSDGKKIRIKSTVQI